RERGGSLIDAAVDTGVEAATGSFSSRCPKTLFVIGDQNHWREVCVHSRHSVRRFSRDFAQNFSQDFGPSFAQRFSHDLSHQLWLGLVTPIESRLEARAKNWLALMF